MDCPNCPDHQLASILTREGVEIDRCPNCQGVWLDRGELFLFTRYPKAVSKAHDEALRTPRQGERVSPASGKPMQQITYPGGPVFDHCPETGGLWLEAGELDARIAGNLKITITPDPGRAGTRATGQKPFGRRKRPQKAAPVPGGGPETPPAGPVPLPPLPNLFLRSTVTLVGLYAVLTLILLTAVEFLGLPLEGAVLGGLAAIFIQFLIGPLVMDLMLRWLYSARWVDFDELPRHLKDFVTRVGKDHDIKRPRFGIIDDGAPQAFTYGHVPSNARIVLSRGLFELLDDDEVEAVVAHEIGHAVHWDILLMTLAQMVPLILYYVFRTLMRFARSGKKDKDNGQILVVAAGAYVLYIVSEYVVLWFSRTREYHADRFSGGATGNPASLASALAKIAYGLAGTEPKEGKRDSRMDAIGALGIFDAGTARTMAIAGFSGGQAGTAVNPDALKGAMRWDLWNPWAKWFELNSTHPLVAKRLQRLSDQALHMGLAPYVRFDERQPESYWDEFLLDITIHLLPLLVLIVVPGWFFLIFASQVPVDPMVGATIAGFGLAQLIRYYFVYEARFFPEMSVAALLRKVKVSAVRPVPCALQGTIIGRGVPGYLFSEDFVMKDGTGIMFLDYRQPLAIWEALFGLLKAGKMAGKEVQVEGWYRRSPVPYVEIRTFTCDGVTRRSWVPVMKFLWGLLLVGLGGLFLLPNLHLTTMIWRWLGS